MADKSKTLYCFFCGKSQHEVRKLIAGPASFICDECVVLCVDILKDELSKSSLNKFNKFFIRKTSLDKFNGFLVPKTSLDKFEESFKALEKSLDEAGWPLDKDLKQ